jgi:hypothetical protein
MRSWTSTPASISSSAVAAATSQDSTFGCLSSRLHVTREFTVRSSSSVTCPRFSVHSSHLCFSSPHSHLCLTHSVSQSSSLQSHHKSSAGFRFPFAHSLCSPLSAPMGFALHVMYQSRCSRVTSSHNMFIIHQRHIHNNTCESEDASWKGNSLGRVIATRFTPR